MRPVILLDYKYNTMTNVQTITLAISIALISGIATFAWNNKTLSEQVEEHNIEVLEECLTKARSKTTSDEILRATKNCNEDILTNISTPRSVETITWTHSTGNTVQPLWFQLIPTAEAKSVENVSKESLTGSIKVSITHSTIWDTNTWNVRTPKQIYEQVNCNTECKIETLTKLWITSTLSNLIVSECKEWSIDPRHCIIIASSIVINESGGGKSNACKARYNCFWFWWWKIIYTSYQESVANFVSTYSRKWYKAKDSSFFYPNKWEYSPSRYCVSESSSNSDIWCPFWQKHMQNTWNKLEKLF